jgi:hypothetical protein
MKNHIKGVSAESVEQQLSRLRSSPLFSHSRRYPIFLDYVVRKTLDGHSDQLKERTVGVEAFGRPSSYDLNADPVVRVTAGEVRKRLAQYYYEPHHQNELRIELRPGSYVPEFRHASDSAASMPEAVELAIADDSSPARFQPETAFAVQPVPVVISSTAIADLPARRWKRIAAGLTIALILATGAAALPLLHRTSATDTFWKPVVEANGPVLISVASVVAMVNSNAVAPAPSSVSGHPLALDPIAISDANALSSIQQVLSVREKPTTLESSTGTTFADLQKGPVVLIAGFNNQWTLRITEPLRFHFVRTSTDEYTIQDRSNPQQKWGINTAGAFVKMDQDFGIVARFHDPTTEQLVVVAAGIGENGTLAASRILTDERYLSELKRNNLLPAADKNFEAVVETQIIDGKPGPPRVVASYVW